MPLTREEIVENLKKIVGPARVITDKAVLQKNSIDRFRKYADIHGVFTLPLPAAVVMLENTEQVSQVLAFLNKHKINCVPRTGASATEGGLETVVENSVVLDGSGLNKVIKIDIENMQATAQCGVPLEVLETNCAAKAIPPVTLRSLSLSRRWAAWLPRAALASFQRCMAQSKIWWWG